MKSNLISKSQTVAILREIGQRWKMQIPRVKNLRVYKIDSDEEIITGGDLKFLHIDCEYIPFLSQVSLLEKFPTVTVDMGAVKFMCNGANVMRPGILTHTEFDENQIVCVIEESQHKFLAVGKAMMSSAQMDATDKGEVIKNIHYISDKFWEAGKTIRD